MPAPVKIIGTFISPYVRKVLVTLNLKSVAWEIDPVIGFMGDDRFTQLSPLRRIPVLIDDQVTLCDSTVICEYLEERYPQPSILPKSAADRARARWLEEYADTRMGDVIIWQLFNQLAVQPFVWGKATDQSIVDKTLQQDLPQVLDYLETQMPAEGFFFGGALTVADIGVAAPLRNASFVRYKPDAARWPKTAGWLERVFAHPAFAALKTWEDTQRKSPLKEQRAALAAIGAPLTADSLQADKPRPGIMRIP